MADLLQDFEDYFVSKGLISAGALFKDMMPDSPDNVVAMYEYEGAAPRPQMGGVLRSIQLVVRDKNIVVAKNKANMIYNALLTDDGILYLTSQRWTLLTLRQSPFKMRVDVKNRVYYAFNLGVITYQD